MGALSTNIIGQSNRIWYDQNPHVVNKVSMHDLTVGVWFAGSEHQSQGKCFTKQETLTIVLK
jgi:hypothetical protein